MYASFYLDKIDVCTNYLVVSRCLITFSDIPTQLLYNYILKYVQV